MIDYNEIVSNLEEDKVKSLLKSLGADVQDKGGYFICNTICHNEEADDASMKLYYYKNTKLFYCYTECGAMSIFTFLKHYYETRQIEYDWYEDILKVVLNCSLQREINSNRYKPMRSEYFLKKERKELPSFNKNVLGCFVKAYPAEWIREGITPAAMDKYNILFSISQNKIIIPHYDVNDNLVGIRGRALNEQEIENFGKYMPVQIENVWYSHPLSLNLYGLNFNKDNIKRYGIAYVFEGEKSVLLSENLHMPNCAVASCGSSFNKYQLDLLMRYCQPKEIVLCYDREEKEGQSTYFAKLWKTCEKYRNYCNMSFIYDDRKITDLKAAPIDMGENVFLSLLDRRVKVK